MRSVTVLVALVAQAYASSTADKLLDRGVSPVDHTNLDVTTLGKPGHVAMSPRMSARPFVPPSSAALSRNMALPGGLASSAPIYKPQLRGPMTMGRNTPARNIKVNAVAIDAKTCKELRDKTGAGMMDCKKALVEMEGDVEKAEEYLRKKGIASADKKAGRAAGEGIIETYVHTGAKLGVMVELNCETDFVAKNPEFKELARSIAMQIAASPTVMAVTDADVDQKWLDKEKKVLMGSEDMMSKPEDIREKMVEGRLKKIKKELVLMDTPYIRDPDMSVSDLIKERISKFGENIKVARFVRFNVGEAADDEPAPEPAAEAAAPAAA